MKNSKLKKIVALMISLVLVVATSVIISLSATANDSIVFEYNDVTGELTVTGTGAIDDYSETELEAIPWYEYRNIVNTITVSEGITEIGNYAFCREVNVTEVNLPSTLTRIGYSAFAGCTNLKSITVPDTVTAVGDYAFGFAYDMSLTKGFVAHCGKNSAAQSYCIKSYVPFDTPFDASGVDTAVILGSNWQAMWSFVPKADGVLHFWTVGGPDTRGLIYDASNYVYNEKYFEMQKSAITQGDDISNDNTNFEITYDVTAGKRYYLAVKYQSATKTSGSIETHMEFTCTDHNYTVTDTATCTEAGTKTYVCEACGDTYNEISQAKGHTSADAVIENDVKSTCAEYGSYDEVVYCSVCSAEISRDTKDYEELAEHNYVFVRTVNPTCTDPGADMYECTVCHDIYADNIKVSLGHTPAEAVEENRVESTCEEQGHYDTVVYCETCETELERTTTYLELLDHDYVHSTIAPTCTKDGAEVDTCKECGDVQSTPIPALGHSYTEIIGFADGEVGVVCDRCDKYKTYTFMNYLNTEFALLDVVEDGIVNAKDYAKLRREYTTPDVACDIDLTAGTVSRENATLADNVLTLTPSGRYSTFNITGDATGVTIVVNAASDTDIKLANANITVDSANAITVNNTATDGTVPTVTISASEGSANSITTTTTGNAVANYSDNGACKLELKGHGTLTLNTASTAINSGGKIEIKNITLDITSGNRGMDTKFTNAGVDDYASIDVEGNATITINATDDGIRCKNFETKALGAGEVDSIINITAGGDGIQMEGKKSAFNSGNITIEAKGYAFNCAAANFKLNAGSTINATGKKGFSK